jgi:hypothetical protein
MRRCCVDPLLLESAPLPLRPALQTGAVFSCHGTVLSQVSWKKPYFFDGRLA